MTLFPPVVTFLLSSAEKPPGKYFEASGAAAGACLQVEGKGNFMVTEENLSVFSRGARCWHPCLQQMTPGFEDFHVGATRTHT